jgi:hypothetical protein
MLLVCRAVLLRYGTLAVVEWHSLHRKISINFSVASVSRGFGRT